MKTTESVEDFYKRLPGQVGTLHPANNTGIGHFNVFSREACSVVSPYSRRDFYKASLIIGQGKIYYADKWVQIDRPAMLFQIRWYPIPGSRNLRLSLAGIVCLPKGLYSTAKG
ncbi:hypothetical protein LWM68_01550 [Niabella sp. W65]|nr:hypothetical protein [Niabella sp. W65]MCH7361584.1 hypothetical protein [Niabella sp. W65]ULT45375.1 hypothetical protein KRR40_20110 [Niabella sp. I65]